MGPKILRWVAVVPAAIGGFLYLGGVFWGIGLILAGGGAYYLSRYLSLPRDRFGELIRGHGRILVVPLLGILVALVVGAAIMLASGYNPIKAYAALFYGGFIKNWYVSVLNAAPLIFTGLSVAFAFKAGLFNIGAEGQYYVGAMAAAWLGLTLNLPGWAAVPLIFVVAAAVSASWNAIPAYLKVRTGAHEVITTMMLAHTARYVSNIFIRAMGGDTGGTHPYVTDKIPEAAWLPRFQQLIPQANYRLHMGILLAIGLAILIHFLLNRTRFGYEIRVVGQNPHAARTQGISVGRNIWRAMLVAGALAGLAGFNQVIGLEHKLAQDLQAGYGWNGISVALLAGNHPIGVVFTALLWGALDAGGQYMARVESTPNSIVEIIKGIILFLIVARYLSTIVISRFRPRANPAVAVERA